MRSQSWHASLRDNLKHTTERVAIAAFLVNQGDHAALCQIVSAIQCSVIRYLGNRRPLKIERHSRHATKLNHVAPDLDAKVQKELLREGATRNSRRRFSRRCPLQNVAQIARTV